MNDKPTLCTIEDLLFKEQYTIPVYQRNYAWGREEIAQLIADIASHINEPTQQVYYTGTLVVAATSCNNAHTYETIDGQQRLTTLNLIALVLKNCYKISEFDALSNINIVFSSRPVSMNAFNAVLNNRQFDDNCNVEIIEAYEHACNELKSRLKETGCTAQQFATTMLKRVKMLRVVVPAKTDLNHYFEVMNTRGEQLEKHEILKARCLDWLQNDDISTSVFAHIWDACADMNTYVQYNFNAAWRNILFAKDDMYKLNFTEFDSLALSVGAIAITGQDKRTLTSILNQPVAITTGKENGNDNPEVKYSSIIDFPNFLLHVLHVNLSKNVALDDKQLIKEFDAELKQGGSKFVKKFALDLLRIRTLFDRYVIRRRDKDSSKPWSIKQLMRYPNNNIDYVSTFRDNTHRIIMLQAMFHVSSPARIYKYWLAALLTRLSSMSTVTADNLVHYLERLAHAYLIDRFMNNDRTEYYDIATNVDIPPINRKPDESLLRYDTVGNYVFNYLDYLLWAESPKEYNWFQFRQRSSVEHYFPQHPYGNRIHEKFLHHFGNLCLISSSENSRLNNRSPQEKRDNILKLGRVESIKQSKMLSFSENWSEDEIEKHGAEMIRILLELPPAVKAAKSQYTAEEPC